MESEKLKEILRKHQDWLNGKDGGERANLRGADLHSANLSCADLRSANLDFSCWPLWCGSMFAIIDDRLKAQLLYHFLSVAPEFKTQELIDFANKFHREDVPRLTFMPEVSLKIK